MTRWIPVLLILIAATAAHAQLSLPKDTLDYPPPRNMITVNPGGIAVDYVGLTYFHGFSQWHAFGVFGDFIYRPVGSQAASGFDAGIAYRYYPGGKALWRFHYGPLLAFQSIHLAGDAETSASGIGVGFAGGWQWFPERGFAVAFGIGAQYTVPFQRDVHSVVKSVFGLRPLVMIDLGYAFP